MLSKARTNVPLVSGELTTKEVESFPVWEVFTQKKEPDAHLHAGSLSAPDASFAQQFAREHYGQDQECTSLWVGLRETFTCDTGGLETYEVFIQWKAGDKHEHVGEAEAANGAEAKVKGAEQFVGDKTNCSMWVAPISKLTKISSSTNMIWRETTKQEYRLAKGYSRIVRQKWEALRAKKAVDAYQEEDLKDTY